MFSRSFGLIFLAVSFCVQAVPHFRQEDCNAISTVVQTVTVTAPVPAATSDTGSNKNGSRVVNNGGNANPPISSATASATLRHGGDSANEDGHGSRTSASLSAAESTSTGAGNKTKTKTGNKSGGNTANAQTSLELNPAVIATGFANDGQDVPTAGQVSSLTSKNNFINFCLTVPNLPITNGKQITTGSCNPAPMGLIPSSDNMPSSKFTSPKNFGTLKANQTFTIEMAIQNMEAGFFVNADANYFAAPQQLNAQGQIQGHSHVVIEELTSLAQTTPTNPKNFVFFKGLNSAANNGKLSTTVPNGLKVGFYKLSSINTASNHQPALVPIAQHGSLDDAIYFSVTSDGVAASHGGKSASDTPSAGKHVPPASTVVKTTVATHLSDSHGSPASNTVLSSATTSATLLPGTPDNERLSSPSSLIPCSTPLPSMMGKGKLRSRFSLKI